jgi:hypothetical protein
MKDRRRLAIRELEHLPERRCAEHRRGSVIIDVVLVDNRVVGGAVNRQPLVWQSANAAGQESNALGREGMWTREV